MSKAFKILVDIIIILCLVCVAALLVPPLVGVETEVAGPQMDKNIAEGSVAYGVRRPAMTLENGDEILYSDDTSLYLYSVDKVDADNGEVYVTNKTTSDELVLQMDRNATKKVLIVPYIGYALLALHSKNGLAMLISGAVVLAALFILATVWDKKRKDKKAAKRDEDGEYFAALAQSVDKPSKLDDLYRPGTAQTETPAAPAAVDLPTVEIPDIREEEEEFPPLSEEISGDASDLEYTEELPPAEEQNVPDLGETRQVAAPEQSAATAAEAAAAAGATVVVAKEAEKHAEKSAAEPVRQEPVRPAPAKQPKQEAAPFDAEAFDKVPDDHSLASLNMSDNEIPDVSDALVAALETTQVSRSDRTYQQVAPAPEPEPEEEEPDEIELAIPVRSANEILDDAYRKGYDPQVITDEVTGVKLVDFSDCF